MLHHKAVVAGKVRLTLRAVNNERINGRSGSELNRRREACATHTDDTCIKRALDKLLTTCVGNGGHIVRFVQSVVFDVNVRFNSARTVGVRRYSEYFTAYAGVNVTAYHAVGSSNNLTDFHFIPHCNHGRCRLAERHGHGQRYEFGRRAIFYRLISRRLATGNVHSAGKIKSFYLFQEFLLGILPSSTLSGKCITSKCTTTPTNRPLTAPIKAR